MSIRELSRVHNVHRRTVRAALSSAVPPLRKEAERVAPVLGPWVETITGWLREDLTRPKKQRHTGRRVWQRLIEEEGAVLAESTVTHAVARIRRELVSGISQVMVPQTHLPAEEAEVDFGEFWAVIAGVELKLWIFVLRLSFSGRAVHVAYSNQAQESFLDGHELAFDRFGGVPTRMVRYDNLKTAVLRQLLGRDRVENPRFIALRSHYGFDSFFCKPGIEGAHEKGGVEGDIGRFRRRWLTPLPVFSSIAELNEYLEQCDGRDDGRVISAKPATVGALFAQEAPLLRPLPPGSFDAAETLSAKADAKSRICVRQSYYSVPARYAGRRVSVRLGARQVEVFAEGKRVAVHVRAIHRNSYVLELDHYLEVLQRKPGAFAGATALVSARTSGAFTPGHQHFWDRARRQLGDSGGTRALIEVLLLHRTLPADIVAQTMRHAILQKDFDLEHLAVFARTHVGSATPTVPITPLAATIHLPERQAPSLARYDQLLTAFGGSR